MKKTEIEKNCLDLEYKKQLQIMNAVIILATTGIISFIGTFIWNKDLLLLGAAISFAILVVCRIIYANINRKLQEIAESIRSLKEV
ncbi:MAG TPA: hypothetical protein VJJ75_02095 [Candidatus Nanoarchaeia archaeon]|nr:hypothetical protein [Candidatus Nanoarchaeia archaeon]